MKSIVKHLKLGSQIISLTALTAPKQKLTANSLHPKKTAEKTQYESGS